MLDWACNDAIVEFDARSQCFASMPGEREIRTCHNGEHQQETRSLMQKETFGSKVASLRKGKGMTQLDLAEKMGVTDKAVSKWERDLSLPDVSSIPRLAEVLDVSVDELLQAKTMRAENETRDKVTSFVNLAFKAVALAMGVAVAALSILGQIDASSAFIMLGIGLACLAAVQLSKQSEG